MLRIITRTEPSTQRSIRLLTQPLCLPLVSCCGLQVLSMAVEYSLLSPQSSQHTSLNFELSTMHNFLFTIHYSLFTIHYSLFNSLFTIHYSLFTIHYSLITVHYSLFTIHYSLFTIHYSLFTVHCYDASTESLANHVKCSPCTIYFASHAVQA